MKRRLQETRPKQSSGTPSFKNGEIVWAKLKKSHDCWPAMVINYKVVGMKKPSHEEVIVYWFGDHRTSVVLKENVMNFKKNLNSQFEIIKPDFSPRTMPILKKGILEVIKVASQIVNYNLPEKIDLLQIGDLKKKITQVHANNTIRMGDIPEFVLKEILNIKKLRPEIKFKNSKDSYNHVAESSVKKMHSDYCFCCRDTMAESYDHPFFEATMCGICIEVLKAMLIQGQEENMCILCTQKFEESVTCSKNFCKRNYCMECIMDFCGINTWNKFKFCKKFVCFLCYDYHSTVRGIVQPKPEQHRAELVSMNEPVNMTAPSIPECKTPIRVLSLFDGISTGFHVLEKLKFSIDAYYAAEIDEDATRVSQFNFGNKIIHIGDVTKIDKEFIEKIGPIDLLIGGSPCNDISKVNPARKGLNDQRGTGILFFDFYRILKELQLAQKDHHVFWLFENVASMDISSRTLISRFFNISPVHLNAKYLSPQERDRCFWGNIPNLYSVDNFLKLSKASLSLNDYLIPNMNRISAVDRLRTVTTNRNSLKQGPLKKDPIIMDGCGDIPWIIELESVFGFPRHYTDVGELSITKRRRLIGKSWSVPVIEAIFKPLLDYFINEVTEHA